MPTNLLAFRRAAARLLILLLAFTLTLPVIAQEPAGEYLDLVEQARGHSEAGEYPDAIDAYTDALEVEETFEAYLGRGWARYYNDGTEEQGLADFERALELRPGDVYARVGRGYANAFLGHAREALADLDVYLQVETADAGAYFQRSQVRAQLGRHAQALEDRRMAASLDRRYAVADDEAPEDELDPEAVAFLMLVALVWAVVMGVLGLAFTRAGNRALLVQTGRGTPLVYDGHGRELFRIYLQNVVLTLLTLGVYRFWAKVRNRQFHYQHTSFAKGRLDYHATGLEKFVGFLKGLVILAPGAIGLWFLNRWATAEADEELASLLVTWGFLLFMFCLRPLILVGAQRFNLARTSWNNLRLHFDGRVRDAYRLYARDLLLLICTFGLYWSWHACRVRAFKWRHTRIGNAGFSFHGEGREYFGVHFVGVFLSYVTLGLYLPWYIAARQRFFVWNTRFEGKRFESDLTGRAVLAVGGPALLMILLSLGLALPWAITRWRALLSHTTVYSAEIDPARIASIRDSAATSTLEGLGEAGELLGEIGDLFGL